MSWNMLRPASLWIMLGWLAIASTALAQPGVRQRADLTTKLNFDRLQPAQQAVVAVVLDIQPGFHAQSHQPLDENLIAFRVTLQSEHVEVFEPVYPQAIIKEYPALGRISVYDGRAITYIPIQVKADAPPGPIELTGTARFQICDDQVCYMPETRRFTLVTEIVPVSQTVTPQNPELFAGFDPRIWSSVRPAVDVEQTTTQPRTTLFGFALTHDAYLLAFVGAFLIGIVFNIVPCVLPVLPLKAIGFYEVAQHNRGKCLALGAVFGAGIVATFGALAIPVLVLQAIQWGELFGNVYFASIITVILVVMAAGMFGAFGVGLPTWVYRITPRHDTYMGNFLFGILTAVLSTPCTFGLFFTLLVWAAAQPPVIGVSMLMSVGLGMAFPYLVLSAFPELARRFPRTGPWSEVVKQMMGFWILAVALYFAQVLLPESLRGPGIWWALFAMIAASALFLIVRAIQLAPRVVPITVSVVIALLLVTPALAVTLRLANPPVQWIPYTHETLQQALGKGSPVLVKFTAIWCANCHTIEATVFADERVLSELRRRNVIPIKADLTSQAAPGWDLLRELHPVGAIPFTAVYLPGETSPRTLTGIYSSRELLTTLGS